MYKYVLLNIFYFISQSKEYWYFKNVKKLNYSVKWGGDLKEPRKLMFRPP